MKIFIVDDNENFRQRLKLFLEGHLNHKVTGEASSGLEFIENPDLNAEIILMDISMPELNGIETAKRVLWKHNNLKIIALSQYDELADLESLIGGGYKGFVSKTNLYRDLEAAIEVVASGELFFE